MNNILNNGPPNIAQKQLLLKPGVCRSAPNVSTRVLAPVVLLMILIWWC